MNISPSDWIVADSSSRIDQYFATIIYKHHTGISRYNSTDDKNTKGKYQYSRGYHYIILFFPKFLSELENLKVRGKESIWCVGYSHFVNNRVEQLPVGLLHGDNTPHGLFPCDLYANH